MKQIKIDLVSFGEDFEEFAVLEKTANGFKVIEKGFENEELAEEYVYSYSEYADMIEGEDFEVVY